MYDVEKAKARYLELCEDIDRPGIDALLEWIKKTDFFEAPASTRFHGAFEGGLLQHSLNVYDELCRILEVYREIKPSHETIVIIALFHDLCKVNFYATEKRNRKNEAGQWETYNAYTIKEQFCYGGHGSKSVFLIQHFMPLEIEEAVAINNHMGAFDNENVGKTYEKFPLAWALHVADEAATYLTEGES